MAGAILGKLSLLERDTSGTGSWSTIGEVYEFGEFVQERVYVETTPHSTSLYREYIAGLYEPIDFTSSLNYIQAEYTLLFGLLGDGTEHPYRIVWPDNYAHLFNAKVSNVTDRTPLDDRITYAVTLRINGAVTFEVVT